MRLLLAAMAYTLTQRLRDLALCGSELARATAATIRVRLLKIGAAVMRIGPRDLTCLVQLKHLRG